MTAFSLSALVIFNVHNRDVKITYEEFFRPILTIMPFRTKDRAAV